MGVKELLIRRQATMAPRKILLAGLGGVITIGILALATEIFHQPFLAAVFGASCVLVFALPQAPLSQPINVIGGHLVSTVCGLLVSWLLPHQWWSIGLAVGAAIVAMAALRVIHPPAGADPIVVITASSSLSYLVLPIALGAVIVVALGIIYHRLTGTDYPLGVFVSKKASPQS